MSVHVLATGRLIAEPMRRATKNGDPMALATLAATVPLPRDAEGDPSMLVGVVCFGAAAESLLAHAKGETIAVSEGPSLPPVLSGFWPQSVGP